MHPRLFIQLAAILIIGCAPSEFIVRKDYAKKDYKDMGLAVVAISPGQIDSNSYFGFNYFFKPDPAHASVALADSFNHYFSTYIEDSSYLVLPFNLPAVSCDSGCRVFSQTIDSGKKDERVLQFRIPDSSALFSGERSGRYALFTQNLVINDTLDAPGFWASVPAAGMPNNLPGAGGSALLMSGAVGALTASSLQLELSTEYILWDYLKGDCVTSGILKDRVTAAYTLDRNDWRLLFRYAADRLLRRAHLMRPAK